MAYQVTARKWRPRKFDEVVAQDHITTTLKNAILSERITQCYLLCGPRGVGKTTTARILAKALNCSNRVEADPCDACNSCHSIAAGTSMNVLEIDGASNNSVDDIRELREVVRYASTEGAYKIYIIDEVHMLSTAAFNALLKTLEEPPAHVVFIFATTEVQAVPDTILSRCQRFNFRRVAAGRIAAHLRVITDKEGIKADERALFLLADRADGALRDAESLFDQVVSLDAGGVSVEAVEQVLGLVDRNLYFELIDAIRDASPALVLDGISRAIEAGAEVEEFAHGLVEILRHLLFAKVQGSAAELDVAENDRDRYQQLATAFATEDLMRMLQILMDLESEFKRSVSPRFRLELALVRLAMMGRAVDVGELLLRLKALEEGGGQTAVQGAPAASQHEVSTPRVVEPITRPPETLRSKSEVPPEPAVVPTPEPVRSQAAPIQQMPEPTVAASIPADNAGETAAAIKFEHIQAHWEELVDSVRAVQPALAIFLKGAQLIALEGKMIKLGFGAEDRFPMAQVVKNRDSIEAICAEKWGEVLRLNCVVVDEPPDTEEGKKKPDSPQGDPTVKSVLDAFDGELV
ncbi:MAG: DNA polymerase III subunit gamma/tau [Candidatus Latescibacterota bacterium]|jgi:DNA polymerase-3 subunit gamma/tau